jgi:hypothetical protein
MIESPFFSDKGYVFIDAAYIDFKKKILGFHLSVTLENDGISFSGNQNIYLKSCNTLQSACQAFLRGLKDFQD